MTTTTLPTTTLPPGVVPAGVVPPTLPEPGAEQPADPAAARAAITAAFVLAVTYPQAGNLAGGGFAVVRTAEGGFFALDFRETAPAGDYERLIRYAPADAGPEIAAWLPGEACAAAVRTQRSPCPLQSAPCLVRQQTDPAGK